MVQCPPQRGKLKVRRLERCAAKWDRNLRLILNRIRKDTYAKVRSNVAQPLQGKSNDPSPGSLRSPPSPHERGLVFSVSAIAPRERAGNYVFALSGGEGEPRSAFSPADAGRVRGYELEITTCHDYAPW